jgi:sec-independent protein translocase protein TatA
MFGLGTTELIVIGVIVFFIFGAKRLPEIGKGIGGAVREFRQVKKDLAPEKKIEEKQAENADNEQTAQAPSLERRLGEKVMGQIPGVKKAMQVKDKVDKVKDLMNT